jgi:NAD(P)-dependent dehydrogenase (short-subunit alcohol dehydrogenase family)
MAAITDVSSMASVTETLKKIQKKYSQPPDIVVNSAGITIDKYLLRMTEESFDKVIDINLKGTFLVNQVTANAMKEAGLRGSIVNISSLVGT